MKNVGAPLLLPGRALAALTAALGLLSGAACTATPFEDGSSAGASSSLALPLETEAPPPVQSDRRAVVKIMATGGPGASRAAAAALLGSDADVSAFLNDEYPALQHRDQRVRAAQILGGGGPTLKIAAQAALAGTPEELSAFVSGGYQQALARDQRVRVAELMALGGPALRTACDLALAGSAEDVVRFLSTGLADASARDAQIGRAHV